jgi:hypothetical protein
MLSIFWLNYCLFPPSFLSKQAFYKIQWKRKENRQKVDSENPEEDGKQEPNQQSEEPNQLRGEPTTRRGRKPKDPDSPDHDRLFKELITTFFVEFLEAFVPHVAPDLDRDNIAFLDKEIFTDVTKGAKYTSDIIVKTKFRGEDAFFLIFVENQSYKETDFPQRMFTYFARFHEKHKIPVYPIALFSYDAPRKKEPSQYTVQVKGFTVCQFNYRVVQLNTLSWRKYAKSPNPAATALMSKMRIAPRDRVKVKLECLRLIATLQLDEARAHLISGFVQTYLQLSTKEYEKLKVLIADLPEQEEKEKVITLTNEWIEEGKKEGTESERQRIVRIAQKQLLGKFGNSAQVIIPSLEKLRPDDLESLLGMLFDFSNFDEASKWIQSRS